MALTLSTLPVIYPVYNNNLILDAYESSATNLFNYKFEVYINSTLIDSFYYPANPLDYHATINLSSVLSTYFETQVYTPTGITMYEPIANSVVPYHVDVNVYTSGGTFVSSGVTATAYTFNGCINMEESLNMQDFIMSGNSTGYFLTNWHTNRSVMLGDYAYLSVITGKYGTGYNSGFGGITITRYQSDGSSSAVTYNYAGTTKTIVNIDISPKSINVVHNNFINANTIFYTINEVNGYNKLQMRIDIQTEYKIQKYYNFFYVNRLGGTDFFTFCKVSDNEYSISKNQLEQFIIQKTYYTDVKNVVSVQSQFLSAYQAAKLQELFSSASVKLFFNGKVNDVTVVNNKLIVPDRYPKDKFIQYDIQYKYSYKYFTQQY